MSRYPLEVADIFRHHGPVWRKHQQGHLSLSQLKVMTAIERCRTAELGGHSLRCSHCEKTQIAYNSCRNRHCPKCQAVKARQWLEARQAELLPVEYYHVVFTLPEPISQLAYHNKAIIYHLLFKAASETLLTIARDPKHLGANIGMSMVLHTWGSALTLHPHVHCIVPGGGFSKDGQQWINCKPGFFLPVRVLSRLFRRLMIEKIQESYKAGALAFFTHQQDLRDAQCFKHWCKTLLEQEWVVYSKRPFAGPKAVLAYLSRYTHRVAIANSRLISHDEQNVTFKWKDYRCKGHKKYKTMTLESGEFMRRFLLHVLPSGFHRIRHYGFFSNTVRKAKVEQAHNLLSQPITDESVMTKEDYPDDQASISKSVFVCPACGEPMIIIESFLSDSVPRAPPGIIQP